MMTWKEMSEKVRCKNFKNKKPSAPPQLVTSLHSLLLWHSSSTGKLHDASWAVVFLLLLAVARAPEVSNWSLLPPSISAFPWIPCLPGVLIFPRQSFLNCALHPWTATVIVLRLGKYLCPLKRPDYKLDSRQWCWPKDLTCSITGEPHT